MKSRIPTCNKGRRKMQSLFVEIVYTYTIVNEDAIVTESVG